MADAPMLGTPSRDVTDLFASVKRATRYASAGAAVVVLAIVGSDVGASDPGESDLAPTPSASASNAAVIAPPPAARSGAAAIGVSAVATPSSESHAAPVAKAASPARASDTPASAPTAPVGAMPVLRKLVVPKVAMPSLDSLMRSGDRVARDDDSSRNAVGAGFLPSASNEEASVRPPVLVYAPTLRFPDELRAKPMDGEVIVQFRVNDKGRVDASTMQVVQSGHELFTAAVRNVLPRFRFEPARASTPGSKPQAAWVQFRAEFSGRN
jgi:TonB family protein